MCLRSGIELDDLALAERTDDGAIRDAQLRAGAVIRASGGHALGGEQKRCDTATGPNERNVRRYGPPSEDGGDERETDSTAAGTATDTARGATTGSSAGATGCQSARCVLSDRRKILEVPWLEPCR